MGRHHPRIAILTLLLAGLAASPALADAPAPLRVGDPAPPLKVGKWVKGEPVTKFEPGTVYVLEFWATWCGPCRAAMPGITALQKKYAGKVVFIGQNVWEEDESAVPKLIAEMGDKLGYRLALDDKSADPKGAMASTWMAAADQGGIPCTFIVDQAGKVAWIGNPMAMEYPLSRIVAGQFDLAKAAERARRARDAAPLSLQEKFQKLSQAVAAKDAGATTRAVDELGADNPTLAAQGPALKFQALLQVDPDKAYDYLAEPIIDSVKWNPAAVNDFAWAIATSDAIKTRDLKLAQRLAERAVELSERSEPEFLDTLARIYFDEGMTQKAVETETEAVAKATPDNKAHLAANLAKYKAAPLAPLPPSPPPVGSDRRGFRRRVYRHR